MYKKETATAISPQINSIYLATAWFSSNTPGQQITLRPVIFIGNRMLFAICAIKYAIKRSL
ncbi:hypothetical protein LFAB_13615 [Lactiplantibacillus fabifermentans T30PCM01]|uniref:Uncharacterized protein n=1 Tax=Lactiplantibacillus fabifermentans T30PCM01 TaxID=1400520 RepID=W6T554_9LACO|nr:hypothetical protein LFAB_13615 [Lactiplantibacillus fabifermentans T30PCM01]